ncbi:MAG TPA: response regulator transcription factor [Chloroflexia bacterium]|nr:response regulator transcription factor [Chloroflexia bacterium]
MDPLVKENNSSNRLIRILIADDHPGYRAGVVSFLKTYPDKYQIVGEASDGAEAYELCKQLKPDIVILDLNFPRGGPSGTEVIYKLQQDKLGIKIVVLTGDPFVSAKTFEEKDIAKYLDKTASFGSIIEALEELSSNKPYVRNTKPEYLNYSEESQISFSEMDETVSSKEAIRELTNREIEVLIALTTGKSNNDIAQLLCVDTRTVGSHLRNIYSKLRLNNRTAAAIFAVQNKFLLETQLRKN